MGRRGPKPQPTALKLERGKPGHHAINRDEPELPAPLSSEPPAEWSEVAKAEWVRLYGTLVERGVLTEGDMDSFARYCGFVGMIEKYERLIEEVGAEEAHRLGYANYLLKIHTQRRQEAAHLGLTPSSRSGIKAVKPPAKDAAAEKRRKYFGGPA